MSKGFLHHLEERTMKAKVVRFLQGEILPIPGFVFVFEQSETLLDGIQVGFDGQLSIHYGVFAVRVRFVEVVLILYEGGPNHIKDYGSIGPDQNGYGTSSSCWSCGALSIHGYIGAHHQAKATIPDITLHPIDGVEQGIGAPVAGVDIGHSLDVVAIK